MSTSLLVAAADLGTVAEQVATFVGILKDHLRLGASNAKAVRTFVKLVTNLPYQAGFEDTRKDYPVDRYGDRIVLTCVLDHENPSCNGWHKDVGLVEK